MIKFGKLNTIVQVDNLNVDKNQLSFRKNELTIDRCNNGVGRSGSSILKLILRSECHQCIVVKAETAVMDDMLQEKKRGPSTEPWGTHYVMGTEVVHPGFHQKQLNDVIILNVIDILDAPEFKSTTSIGVINL